MGRKVRKVSLWKKVSFVLRGKNRLAVLKALSMPQTPSSISKKTLLSLNTSSRALRELNKERLVVCKTSRLKVGRVYILTNLGKKVFDKLE